jgi:leucyl-tRNA synthetase
MYMMFMGSYEEGGDWSDEGIVGINRFLKRIWRIVWQILDNPPQGGESTRYLKVLRQLHYAIKHATVDLERFHFNTSISRIMELVNEISLYLQDIPLDEQNKDLATAILPGLVQLLAPFAPHFSEELWHALGNNASIFSSAWPTHDDSYLVEATVQLGVQINGKIRGQVEVAVDTPDNEVIAITTADEKIKGYLEGKTIVKSFVVPKKLVSIVVK